VVACWHDAVKIFQTDGTLVTSITNNLEYPVGIAIDSSDYIYVSDYNNDKICKYNSSGTFQASWSTADAPWYIKWDHTRDELIVPENNNNGTIAVYKADGTLVQRYTPAYPYCKSATRDEDGNWFIINTTYNGNRVYMMDPSMSNVIWSYSLGNYSQDITILDNQYIYVTETYGSSGGHDIIRKFNMSGVLVDSWTYLDTQCDKPSGIIFDTNNQMLVGDYWGHDYHASLCTMASFTPQNKNIFEVYTDGKVTAPELTTTLIDNTNTTGKVLVTKEWVTANAGGGDPIEHDYTATAGQTAFVISGKVLTYVGVFVNGVKIKSSNYTISDDGTDTTVTFGSGLNANDWVQLLEY
jgi:hypothetical protein